MHINFGPQYYLLFSNTSFKFNMSQSFGPKIIQGPNTTNSFHSLQRIQSISSASRNLPTSSNDETILTCVHIFTASNGKVTVNLGKYMSKFVQTKKTTVKQYEDPKSSSHLHQSLNSEINCKPSPVTKMDGRDEAARWINLALKLLVNRDLVGTKTFAIRAKEADPTMGYVDEILAVVDTLMAGQQQQQINGRYDWYGILRVERMCRDTEVIASEYRRLALLLNPQRNGLPFAEEAFGLVNEAWSVLSNPLRKSLYDNELSWLDGGSNSGVRVHHQVQQHQFLPIQSQNQVQQQPQPQVVTPMRVQPQVVTPLRAQQQQQHATHQVQQQHAAHQVQQQAPYQPQFQPRPEPQSQMQFQQLTQQTRVQSQPVSQPQVQVHSLPQPRVQSQPVTQPQAQNQFQQRVQSQQVTQPQAQHLPQPQFQSPPVTQPQVQPLGPSHLQRQQQPQVQQQQPQQWHQEPIPIQVDSDPQLWKTPVRSTEELEVEELDSDPVEVDEDEVLTFWTACPYCYHLFEYLKEYEDCTLRCQNKKCRRAFHGSAITPPPESESDKKASFCSWGFFPIGASPVYLNSGKKESGKHSWHPFSPMFTCPMEPSKGVPPVDPNSWKRARPNPKPKAVIVDDDDYVLMELSDSTDDSDTDWGSNSTKRNKRGRPPKVQKSPVRKSTRRGAVEKSNSGTSEAGDHHVGNNGSALDAFKGNGAKDASAANAASTKSGLNVNGNLTKRASGKNPKDLGKLDLNVEFNNEVEETMSTKTSTNGAETSAGAGTSTGAGASTGAGTSAGTGTTSGQEETIEAEGIGFFEGLDEFLNSLPILSAVGDDKVKAA